MSQPDRLPDERVAAIRASAERWAQVVKYVPSQKWPSWRILPADIIALCERLAEAERERDFARATLAVAMPRLEATEARADAAEARVRELEGALREMGEHKVCPRWVQTAVESALVGNEHQERASYYADDDPDYADQWGSP